MDTPFHISLGGLIRLARGCGCGRMDAWMDSATYISFGQALVLFLTYFSLVGLGMGLFRRPGLAVAGIRGCLNIAGVFSSGKADGTGLNWLAFLGEGMVGLLDVLYFWILLRV